MKETAIFLVTLIIVSLFAGCMQSDVKTNPDTDNDGVPDDKDAFPEDPAEQYDSDNDGVGDNSDAFPLDPAASVDSDNDGYPDAWNPGMNQTDSTSTPPLHLDAFPDDPDEWKDEDGDGVGHNSDMDDQVDLAITFTLKSFKVTDKVDPFPIIWRRAQIYFELYIEERRVKRIDNDGFLWRVSLNDRYEVNQEFKYNIDDHKDHRYTDIELIMYDNDLLGRDTVDISSDTQKTLRIHYDAKERTYSGHASGSQATVWYEIISSHVEYNKTYCWQFKNKKWELSLEVPSDTYTHYRGLEVRRNPQILGDQAMASFVTSDEPIIVTLANKLKRMAETQNYNAVETTNLILHFVQYLKYSADNASLGPNEYWRYPVETLVDETGDCEDTSALFASLMEALGHDAVFLLYVIEQNGQQLGHLAVGIDMPGAEGTSASYEGKDYYYCETTTSGYNIGDIPHDYKDQSPRIIEVE